MQEIMIGTTGDATTIVEEKHTAKAVGSGSLMVFSTPAMLALMEAASVAAIASALDETESSVGIAANIEHLSATPMGETVRASAEVIDVNGKRISFFVQAWDDQELIGEGHHTRYIINIEIFMQRVRDNSTQSKT